MSNLGGYGYGPPLSAIQRFLLDSNKSYIFKITPQNNEHVTGEGSVNEFCKDFALSKGAVGRFHNGFGNDGFCDDENHLKWMGEMPPSLGLNHELLWQENIKFSGKKAGRPSVKGQWTPQEDMVLVDLVIKHGDKRWANIAEHMNGRAGKQCRERWHNHLRPDIKKDSWNEEEESMLIEAHIEVGNKWAEIAKRIPGRTENSIKNHWTATKRRQNSKRKFKKVQEGQGRSMLLQEYQIKIFAAAKSIASTPSGSTVTHHSLEESSIDDHSSQLFNQTYDDEYNFMFNLFAKKTDQPSNDDNNKQKMFFMEGKMKEQSVGPYNDKDGIVFSDSFINSPEEQSLVQTYLPSDRYISNLLDGPTNSAFAMNGYNGNFIADSTGGQASCSSSNGKEDMDLMEMVASHQMFSQNTNLKL